MTNKRPTLSVLYKAAARIGATIIVEPEWEIAGQITYKSGIRRYFSFCALDINSMGAAAVARDKDYTKFFLRSMGYSVPRGCTFFSKAWAEVLNVPDKGLDAAYAYAKSIGFPVFVKPNGLSRGKGVCKVWTRAEFYRAVREALRLDKVALVEESVPGRDYRIVVLDGKIIAAYERIPLHVVGNGHTTVSDLLKEKQQQLSTDGRKTILNPTDFRLLRNLERKGLTFDNILPDGQKLTLLDGANLSTGGDPVDLSEAIHPTVRHLAKNVTREMGLRLAGLDLIVDGDLSCRVDKTRHWIIEINAAPGLHHFAAIGKRQQRVVENLYVEVLQSMESSPEVSNSCCG